MLWSVLLYFHMKDDNKSSCRCYRWKHFFYGTSWSKTFETLHTGERSVLLSLPASDANSRYQPMIYDILTLYIQVYTSLNFVKLASGGRGGVLRKANIGIHVILSYSCYFKKFPFVINLFLSTVYDRCKHYFIWIRG